MKLKQYAMTAKILLTTFFLLTLFKVNSQTNIVGDTITNWQVYLGDNKILSENQVDLHSNGVKVIKVKMADLDANKFLLVSINTCAKSIDRHIEIQFGNGKDRYSQDYYKGDNLKIKTSFIKELLAYEKTNQIVLSMNRPPFIQADGRQYGLLLIDLRVE
jgi:hypothetical protein